MLRQEGEECVTKTFGTPLSRMCSALQNMLSCLLLIVCTFIVYFYQFTSSTFTVNPIIWLRTFLLMHGLIRPTVIYCTYSRSGNIVCRVHNLLHLWETSFGCHTIISECCQFFHCVLFGALHVSNEHVSDFAVFLMLMEHGRLSTQRSTTGLLRTNVGKCPFGDVRFLIVLLTHHD